MKTGIIVRYGRCGRYQQGDIVFAEPTNRQMRRLAAKQAKERGAGRSPNQTLDKTTVTTKASVSQ